jgi:pyridoxine 4-dehydrogenase
MAITAREAPTITIGGDLTVHRLGFGAMRITGKGIWREPPDREVARQVVRRAVELGVDVLDTADSYGPDVSEEIIREALTPYPEGLVIATKGGLERTGPNQWPRNGRPEHLREACEGSLRRLGLDRIDLYQLHAPDPEVPYEESVGALKALQDEGKVRHVGVSNVSVEQLATAQSIVDVVSVQNRYSPTDRANQPVLDRCEELGLAFIPWFPLGAGDLGHAGEVLDEIAGAHEATRFQVAIAWLLHTSPVTLPIPGTGNPAHVEENVAAAGLRLSDDEVARLDALG